MPKLSGLTLTLAVLAAVSVARADPPNDPFNGYSSYSEIYTIPYANDPHFGTATPGDPTIALSINGTSFTLPLDTGSRALYVSADTLPANISLNGPTGYVYLNSSNRVFQGTWTTQPVTFTDAVGSGGASGPAVATMPVLVVQSLTASSTPSPGNATASTTFSTIPDSGNVVLTDHSILPFTNHTVTLTPGQVVAFADNPGILQSVANFGVGFDRTGQGTSPNDNSYNQQYNAFLNIAQMQAGTMRAGYILTETGVQLGFTPADSGYAYTNLAPTGLSQVAGSPPDWQAPTGTIVYNGTTYDPGQIVIDIGIPHGILGLPGEPTTGSNVTLPMVVNLINSNGAVSYEINGDGANLLNPTSISWFPPLGGNFSENDLPWNQQFFNTGRNVLNAFDYLYDGEEGFIGLKPNGASIPSANISFTAGYYPTPVPEPSTAVLPMLVLGALLGWRRVGKRAKN